MQEAARGYKGYVVRSNGFEASIIVFPSVRNAVEAAITLQQQLQNAEWPHDINKHEKALRVRDAKSGATIFNGPRARIGIGAGPLVKVNAGFRVDFTGPALNDAIRLGKSCPGGDMWLSVDALNVMDKLSKHMSPVTSGAYRRLMGQLAVRPIALDSNAPVAVSCVLRSMEGRIAKFPSIQVQLERLERVVSAIDKDLGLWWKAPNTIGPRNDAVKLVLTKKRSLVGAALLGEGGAGLNRSPSLIPLHNPSGGGGGSGVVAMLLERLQAVESLLTLPPTSPPKRQQQQQPAASSNVNVANLSQILRATAAVLRGGADASAAVRLLEDACRSLGISSQQGSQAVTPTAAALKKPVPPPAAAAGSKTTRATTQRR